MAPEAWDAPESLLRTPKGSWLEQRVWALWLHSRCLGSVNMDFTKLLRA